jgi:hypothetical protein
MAEIHDLNVYRKIKKLKKNNDVLVRALAVFDHDKARYEAIIKEYDHKN